MVVPYTLLQLASAREYCSSESRVVQIIFSHALLLSGNLMTVELGLQLIGLAVFPGSAAAAAAEDATDARLENIPVSHRRC